jgi:hypothetical protein
MQPELKHYLVYAFLFSPKIYSSHLSQYKIGDNKIYKLMAWLQIDFINPSQAEEIYLIVNPDIAYIYDCLYDVFYPDVFTYIRKLNLIKIFHHWLSETDWKIICQIMKSKNIQNKR